MLQFKQFQDRRTAMRSIFFAAGYFYYYFSDVVGKAFSAA